MGLATIDSHSQKECALSDYVNQYLQTRTLTFTV